jgi:hypothetical protein
MHDDLLHAQASVDWAVSQLPAFKKRLDAWLKENVDVVVKELPADTPNNVVVAIEKSPLPLAFQVEAGAYINAIRSSLDILAAALANRHCQALVDDAYFPVAYSAEQFALGNYKGPKFVKALPAKERTIIESLKPYNGGNDFLYPLHLLDIVRKHQRLLTAEIRPYHLVVSGWGDVSKNFTFVSTGWMRSGDDETVIGLLAKGAEKPKLNLTMQVSLSETNYLPHREVVTTLYVFARFASAIIKEFDLE